MRGRGKLKRSQRAQAQDSNDPIKEAGANSKAQDTQKR